MKLADTPIGIIVNFQKKSLKHKRLHFILNKFVKICEICGKKI